jgi:branched-chain amino acid aminotransferase
VKVIFNAELIEQEQSQCTPDGWLNGVGIFETIKTINSQPWALTRHMRRAVNSCAREKIAMPSEEVVRSAITRLLQQENHAAGVLRLSFDVSGNWAAVHRAYTQHTKAAKIWSYPVPFAHEAVVLKRYPYDHRLDILHGSVAAGFDEALVINAKNAVCEGAVTNLLLKIAGRWCTPPLSDGVLPGVVRALVIENFEVTVRSIAASEVVDIESAFLLSSLRIAQPVASIDGRELSQSDQFRDEIEAMALRTSVG